MTKINKYYFIIPAIIFIIGIIMIIYGAITLPSGSVYMIIGGVIIGFILVGIPIICTLFYIIKKLFKEKTIWSIIFGIVITVCILSLIIGLILKFANSYPNGYSVNKVKVVESHISSVVIDFTKYNHDDYMTLEIKKPFFIPIKEGDEISVKYKDNNPKSMYYVIDWISGEKILTFGLLSFGILLLLLIFWIVSCIIKGKSMRKGTRNGKK